MRVLLVEDHLLMQERISTLLSAGCTEVEVVGRGDEILPAVLRFRPDAVVLDVSLPGRSGIQVLPELRHRYPDMAIVVHTTHNEPIYRAEAIRRGADAYVLKVKAEEELLPAIRYAFSMRQSRITPVRQRA